MTRSGGAGSRAFRSSIEAQAPGRAGTVRAENLVRGPDQQSCLLTRPAVMITGHVPAIRLSPDHAGGFLVAAVSA